MGLQAAPAFIAKQADGLTDFQHPIELMRGFNQTLFRNTGTFRYGDFFVDSLNSGMTIRVGGGSAYLDGMHGGIQGGYFVWSNGDDVLTVGAASGSTRYDSILLRIADNQYGTISGAPRAYLEVVAGAPGTGSSRPDSYFESGGAGYQPGAWHRLANIQIDPGDTTVSGSKIFRNFQTVHLPGATQLCTSDTRPSFPEPGDKIFEIDYEYTYQWITENGWTLEPRVIRDAVDGVGVPVTTTEANIPNLQLNTAVLRKNTRYLLHVSGNINVGFANDQFELRIRKNTAVTGFLLRRVVVSANTNSPVGHPITYTLPLDIGGSDDLASFHFSLIRPAGGSGAANWMFGYSRLEAYRAI